MMALQIRTNGVKWSEMNEVEHSKHTQNTHRHACRHTHAHTHTHTHQTLQIRTCLHIPFAIATVVEDEVGVVVVAVLVENVTGIAEMASEGNM